MPNRLPLKVLQATWPPPVDRSRSIETLVTVPCEWTYVGPDDHDIWERCRTVATWADDFVVLEDPKGHAWGNEAPWRANLWDAAVAACEPDDWIFILDADFVLTFDPHDLIELGTANAWRFFLYDLWSPTHYRDDQFWHAHFNPRHWMFARAGSPPDPAWGVRGIHTGHYPSNFQFTGIGTAPNDYSILHLGWSTPEIRDRKVARYHKVWSQLSDFERKHVESVSDPNPSLKELPKALGKWLPSESSSAPPLAATPQS